MNDTEAEPCIRISGMSIYAQSASVLEALLPITMSVQIDSDTPVTVTSGNAVLENGYSPSGNRMAYYVLLSSAQDIAIPTGGTEFEISVTLEEHGSQTASFTEDACSPIPNSVICPERIYTGRAYEFTLDRSMRVGNSYTNSASLVWFPQKTGVYTTQIYEYGYTDPYTRVEQAAATFSSVYFAVPNRDALPGADAASLTADANISIQSHYLSSDFTDGILITEITASVPCAPRDEVDPSLAPVLTAAAVALDGSPSNAVIGGKYVHKQATLTFTPAAQFQYGDSIAYIRTGDGANRYGYSVSIQADGVAPGTEYVRPDTGATATAGDESIRGYALSVYGSKWKLGSSEVTKTYTVLYYHAPRIAAFSVHRCVTSQTSTAYLYDGTYYKKDDFGPYCLIEYTTDFSALDNTNDISMTIQYGTHRVSVTPSYSGSGFMVVYAGTAAMEISISLYDTFYPYGVYLKQTLSTAGILIDFLAGGKGMAVGKVAVTQNALDISSDWKLLFYQATVGAYNSGNAEDLIAWMHDVDTRLTALENSTTAN